ncbi:MAG: hypothetical protein ABFD64_07785 [Armatimonadota bacterium]
MTDVIYTSNPAANIKTQLVDAGLPVKGVSVQGLSVRVTMTRDLNDTEKTSYASVMGILASSIIVIPAD